MSMVKIFNIDGAEVSEAWIGHDSPMPDGWHLDVNSAMKANAAKPKPVEVEVKAPLAKVARKARAKDEE